MAGTIARGSLYPAEASRELINLVRGKSTLARLAGQDLIPFNGQTEYVFALDKEVDIVAENDPKSNGGGTVTAKTVVPLKFEYGLRVSDEFVYGSEEIRMNYLRQFNEGFARKIARGVDIAAMHGLNPRTGNPATQTVGTNHLDAQVSNSRTATADADADIDAAVALVEGAEHEVTGIAVAPAERAALAALKANGVKLYPELAWGNQPQSVNGLAFDANSTVSFGTNTKALAYVGNFRDFFKLGYGKDITFEVIQYGNPDNDATAGDLKGHNQVYLRAEAYIGWAILDPTAFAKVVSE